jgi:hypothetical protein
MIQTSIVYTVDEILKYYDKSWDEKEGALKDGTLIESIEFLPSMKELNPNINAKFEDHSPVWNMSFSTAKDTFRYIDRLKTKVYIIKVNNGVLENYILFAPKGSPKELQKFLKNVDPMLHIDKKKKDFIKNYKWKFMGCILQYQEDLLQDLTSHRYYKLMSLLNPEIFKHVQNGLYILSTRDLCLVHKRRMEPWVDVVGSERNDIGFIPKQFLPIFNSTGGENYFDIPIPTFDDIKFVMSTLKPEYKLSGLIQEEFRSLTTLWSAKKPIAVFRGSATGCGYSPENNVRLHLAKLSQDLNDKTLLDAGITRGDLAKEKFIFNRDTGVGFFKLKNYDLRIVERLDKKEQSSYKYVIEIEGNVSAHRVLTDMLFGSLLLMVDSEYTLWYSHLLKPYVHYIPIKKDLSNLLSVVAWCRNNDELCEIIAKNSLQFAKELLTLEVVTNTMSNTLMSIKLN